MGTLHEQRVEVLVVGAGPAGLSLAIELGRRGIRCLVLEQNDRVGLNPRAKTTNVRTREHLRRWGIAQALRDASPMPPDYPTDIVFATRMSGPLLARFENAFNGGRARNDLYSEEAQWVPQYVLEEVLRRHAATLPTVELRFNTRLESFEQDAAGVLARAHDTASGAELEIASAYLVGADGARSSVRSALGIRMSGESAFAKNYNAIFRAPGLAELHGHGRAIMYWLLNPEVPCVMGPMAARDDLWFFITARITDEEMAGLDPRELIQTAAGFRFELEIVGSDPWAAHRLIADRYGEGRVFLAGDACHLHPPFGGYGMNMGVGEAVDLGWKMAATLRGWGGEALLASYETERRPVHRRVMDEAVANYALVGQQLMRPGIEAPGPAGEATRNEVRELLLATKSREFQTLGVVLGSRYADSPIVVPDGSPPLGEHVSLYLPSAHPGCLAPHLWLADGSSLYDHFGAGFTLLATASDPREEAAGLLRAAEARGLPLTLLQPDEPRLEARYGARLALIRPDQHVAWRGDRLPADAGALLDCIRGAAPRRDQSRAAE